jgi:hypothetical protein
MSSASRHLGHPGAPAGPQLRGGRPSDSALLSMKPTGRERGGRAAGAQPGGARRVPGDAGRQMRVGGHPPANRQRPCRPTGVNCADGSSVRGRARHRDGVIARAGTGYAPRFDREAVDAGGVSSPQASHQASTATPRPAAGRRTHRPAPIRCTRTECRRPHPPRFAKPWRIASW